MKKPGKKRWMDGKEFSYVVSWACIVLACAFLFPLIATSAETPSSAKITVCILLGVLFILGVYSLAVDIFDYLSSKKMDENKAEEEELK